MDNKKELLAKFSNNLRRIRNEKGYTQMQVCFNAEIERSLYQKYESNNPPDIRLTNLVKLLKVLEVSLEELLK